MKPWEGVRGLNPHCPLERRKSLVRFRRTPHVRGRSPAASLGGGRISARDGADLSNGTRGASRTRVSGSTARRPAIGPPERAAMSVARVHEKALDIKNRGEQEARLVGTAGWRRSRPRVPHKHEIVGANPTPAPNEIWKAQTGDCSPSSEPIGRSTVTPVGV